MNDPILLGYQQRVWADESPVIVVEKSRRIGMTWALAGKAVELAATGKMDTWYVSYSEDAGKEFIRDAARWAVAYQVAHQSTQLLERFEDGKDSESILVNSVQFANGRRIVALPCRPRSFRGKQGCAILDEAAFLPDFDEFLKAIMAFRMWGGRCYVLSTHDGEANPFNGLVRDIKAGKRDYSHHKVTLDDALRDGLYRRICSTQGRPWTPEAEAEWRAAQVRDYGLAADEELFCVPRRDGGTVFSRDWFSIVDAVPGNVIRTVRAYDFASTAVNGKNRSPDWTRGLRGRLLDTGAIHLDSLVSLQGRPAEVKKLVLETAITDGVRTEVAVFTDPGQAGVYQTDDLITALRGFVVTPERASKNKIDYARPVASFASNGKITLQRATWNDEFLRELSAFPSPHSHDDIVDALSRLFISLSGPTFTIGYESASPPRHTPHDPWARDDDDFPSTSSRGSFL